MSRLANIIDVQVFNDLPAIDTPEKTALFQSGVVVRSPLFDQFANNPGKTSEMIFWKDLDFDQEPNYSNDDPADVSTPNTIAQDDMVARKAFLNNSWTESDLAAELATGGNAMRRIRSRIDTYWQRRWQRGMFKTSIGRRLANVANDGGDMVHDISIQDGNAAVAANLFSRTAAVAAAFTMGDQFDGIKTIAVHSVVYQRMVENDDIDFVADSKGDLVIPTYLGKRIVIDDGCPVINGTTSGFRYVSMFFGEAAFAYGEGSPEVPTAVQREEAQGNGGGVETLFSRKTWLIHPLGHTFTSNTVTGPSGKNTNNISPTDGNLALAANWQRVVDHRKLLPIAFLITNG